MPWQPHMGWSGPESGQALLLLGPGITNFSLSGRPSIQDPVPSLRRRKKKEMTHEKQVQVTRLGRIAFSSFLLAKSGIFVS